MKAIIATKYGAPDVLQLKEVAKPTPKDNEVLVKIHAVSINFGDLLVRNFNKVTPRNFSMPGILWIPTRLALGIRKPRQPIFGSEFSGVIESVGKDVTRFNAGDQVFGYRSMNMGANAEYLAVGENSLIAPKPDNMSYEEVATIPYGALTALNLLRKMDIKAGQKVLINGASGGIGSFAVQLAKSYGADVTGVCGSQRVDMVKALGADKVIDYTKEDFTQNGETYDLIFDVIRKSSFARVKNSLTQNGRYLLASFKMKQLFQMLWTSRFSKKKVVCAISGENLQDLLHIKDLIEDGTIKTVIDRCYPLEQTADAHRYIESGDKKGHVVVTVAQ